LWTLFNIKADFVSLGKGLETTALDGCVMDKDIGAVLSGDEPEAFARVKPLNSSLRHIIHLLPYSSDADEHCKFGLAAP
jgi:hypothetical protein